MKQKFFTESIQSDFIKALVYNTPIPLLDTVRDNSYLTVGNCYIHKGDVIKCLTSGLYKLPEVPEGYNPWQRAGDVLMLPPGADIPVGYSEASQATYKVIGRYRFGMYYPAYTKIYDSNYDYYDTWTHEYLGKLLRCIRDIYDLDLMPFYNCVSCNYISGLLIQNGLVEKADTSGFKTFRVPVKFDTPYTVAIDSSSNVRIAPVLLSGDTMITRVENFTSPTTVTGYEPQAELLADKNNVYDFSSMSFRQPEKVSFCLSSPGFLGDQSKMFQYEKYLNMLIQVPISNNSSVVVLEGDYVDAGVDNIFNVEQINKLNNLQLSNLMISELSLLMLNDGNIWPYANRLIEYLLENVITHRDEVTGDVGRIQRALNIYDYVPDVWSNLLRNDIYQLYRNSDKICFLDLNGFVDKDTETLIKKLK